MFIELRKGMPLYPGTFNAIIAPEKVIIPAINSNTDLQRFLFLYISGNYSRILSSIARTSENFEVCRAFTAHQLFTILQNASHTVVFLEHDPTMFEGAEQMIPQVAGMLKEVGRESLVILYSPSMDKSFSTLMQKADHIIEIAFDESPALLSSRRSISRWHGATPHALQKTLGV
jgi:DNA polymerase I